MHLKNLFFYFIVFCSCWNNSLNPAVNSRYNFNTIGTLEIENIDDYPSSPGSGELILSSLTYNFLKYGYNVNVSNIDNSTISISNNPDNLLLSCIITEFTDSKMIVVPFRHEDKGYTRTVVTQEQSTELEENQNSELGQTQTSTTTTHAGKIKEGKRITYSQSRVGIMLQLKDQKSGELVWSNSYWYSGLEMQRTIESCVKSGVYQIKKLF